MSKTGLSGHLAIPLLALSLGAVVLTWLFLRADAVAPQAHFDYSLELRRLRQADTELNAAVLANRFGLLSNFDPLVAQDQSIRRSLDAAARLPTYLSAADRQRVLKNLDTLRALQEQKTDMIDRFKRENSVLRNSLNYLPGAAEQLLASRNGDIPGGLDRFVRQLLAFTRNPDGDRADALEQMRQKLLTIRLAGDGGKAVANVLRHGQMILRWQLSVDRLTREDRKSTRLNSSHT